MIRSLLRLGAVTAVVATAVGCDYEGEFLFANPTEIPGVIDLGEITPVAVDNPADIAAATVFAEVGATGNASRGGVTFSFVGTGSSVCLWLDPELVTWNQSVAALRPVATYAYPDNSQDDGDLEMQAGYSVYYTGSPGERIGDFEIRYEDSLGNPVEIQLNECTQSGLIQNSGAHGGRGSPESCTLAATSPGVSYTVMLETFSTPLDDDRLGFGMLLADGGCSTVRSAASAQSDECVIRGEAIDPETTIVDDETGEITFGDAIEGSEEFELAFCAATGDDASAEGKLLLPQFCADEAEEKNCADPSQHCFCGDPANTPNSGAN